MQLENQLRTEIEFLQDLIESHGEQIPQDTLLALKANMSVAQVELSELLFGGNYTIH